jgi:hypothetical protein
MDDMGVTVSEAEEEQIIEPPSRVRGPALAAPVRYQPLYETADSADRQLTALELEDKGANLLLGCRRRDLRDTLQLCDLLRVEMEFLRRPVKQVWADPVS